MEINAEYRVMVLDELSFKFNEVSLLKFLCLFEKTNNKNSIFREI